MGGYSIHVVHMYRGAEIAYNATCILFRLHNKGP